LNFLKFKLSIFASSVAGVHSENPMTKKTFANDSTPPDVSLSTIGICSTQLLLAVTDGIP